MSREPPSVCARCGERLLLGDLIEKHGTTSWAHRYRCKMRHCDRAWLHFLESLGVNVRADG